MDFEAKIVSTHLSDDKNELYVLTKKRPKISKQATLIYAFTHKTTKNSNRELLTPEKVKAIKVAISNFYKNPNDRNLSTLFA